MSFVPTTSPLSYLKGEQAPFAWESTVSRRSELMENLFLRDLLKAALIPGIISFAGGLPASEFFPTDEVKKALIRILHERPHLALQYGSHEGYVPLREYLIRVMAEQGVTASLEETLIVTGSQQALDLIGKVFINPGDVILTERPTYVGALQAWDPYEPRYVTVEMDGDGMRLDQVADLLRREPIKFIYAMPNFHNPAGVALSRERREQLAKLAAQYGIFIVEDDPYGSLRYEGEDLPSIKSLNNDHVIYTSTFSKTLSPGVRLGWVVAPESVITRLMQAKQGADLSTSVLSQMIARDMGQRGVIHWHVQHLRTVYRTRRDTMLMALKRYFPEESKWARPQGGMFLWAWIPGELDTNAFLKPAMSDAKVAYVPGIAFYPRGNQVGGRNTMRLNFSNSAPEQTEEGIKRLGDLLKKHLA
jgi:2-aminoadipate transaminase